MNWGFKNRMARIINVDTSKCVMLAIDHGYVLGPIKKIEKPWETIKDLLPFTDSIALTRGILSNCIPEKIETPMILRVSGGVTVAKEDMSNETLITSVKEAVRLNAVATAMSVFIGTQGEHKTLENLGRLIDESHDFHLPVLAITAVGKELEKRDARYLSLACRVLAEYGADIVKTYYCEDFEKVVNTCPVPVVIAGGPKCDTVREVLEITYNAVAAGAAGVDMGRNIWQAENPVSVIKAINGIVHKNLSIKEAEEIYSENT